MAVSTEVTGIFQGHIILRTAVIMAVKEMQDNPNLIRDALASLPQDDLTAPTYGDKTVEQCVTWFQNTKFPVKLGLALARLTSPCIAIELNNEDEAEATIGDVNYLPSEPDPYNVGLTRNLASVQHKVSYNVTCMVQGEPELLLFLYSMVLFGLLRNKERYLDQRGFSRLTWAAGVAARMEEMPGAENFFVRAIRLNAYARDCWPVPLDPDKNSAGPISEVDFGPKLAPVVVLPDGTGSSTPQTPTSPGPTGADPFDPNDWANRDIISGQKMAVVLAQTPAFPYDLPFNLG